MHILYINRRRRVERKRERKKEKKKVLKGHT